MNIEKQLYKTCKVRHHDIQAFALHCCSVQLTETALPLYETSHGVMVDRETPQFPMTTQD